MSLPLDVLKQMRPYWNQVDKGSFNGLHRQILEIEKTATQTRTLALQKLSEKEDAKLIVEYRKVLKTQLQELKQVEKSIERAQGLVNDGYEFAFPADSQGDFNSFEQRVYKLQEDVARAYKDALYPFLLTLQNAEKRWKPSSYICQFCDIYSWWTVKDPKAELEVAFPKIN